MFLRYCYGYGCERARRGDAMTHVLEDATRGLRDALRAARDVVTWAGDAESLFLVSTAGVLEYFVSPVAVFTEKELNDTTPETRVAVFTLVTRSGFVLTSASKFDIEPNGGIVDVSCASPNVKTPVESMAAASLNDVSARLVQLSFLTSASKFHIEPNGGIFDVRSTEKPTVGQNSDNDEPNTNFQNLSVCQK